MTSGKPHYLLFCDGNVSANGESAGSQRGRWRFVLEDLVSGERIEATDQEIGCAPDRSALVAVLRGLEALEQPSRVTLVTTSRYVTRGLQYGLTEWRDNDYSWEHFGAVQPIRNADIWKRIDRALAYHQVQCRWMAQEGAAEPVDETTPTKDEMPSNDTQTKPVPVQIAVACGDGRELASLTSTHRPSRTASNSRVGVSMSNYQRVYVDTPGQPSPVHFVEETAILHQKPNASKVGASEDCSLESNSPTSLTEIFRGPIAWPIKIAYSLLLPVRFVSRGTLLLCGHLWEGILALDECLESFIRCLFLLEPSKRTKRR